GRMDGPAAAVGRWARARARTKGRPAAVVTQPAGHDYLRETVGAPRGCSAIFFHDMSWRAYLYSFIEEVHAGNADEPISSARGGALDRDRLRRGLCRTRLRRR